MLPLIDIFYMAQYIAYFFVGFASLMLLIISLGILRTKSTLEKLHFTTIIDMICFPLIFVAILFTFGMYHTRLFYSMVILVVLSPISAYFVGKVHYTLYKTGANPRSISKSSKN